MKTTITITAESEEGGTRYTINHEGDMPTNHGGTLSLTNAINNYCSANQVAVRSKESLSIMKQRRKDVKQRGKEAAAYVEELQTTGLMDEPEGDVPF